MIDNETELERRALRAGKLNYLAVSLPLLGLLLPGRIGKLLGFSLGVVAAKAAVNRNERVISAWCGS